MEEVLWDLRSFVAWLLIQLINIVHAVKLWQLNSLSSEVSRKIEEKCTHFRVARSIYKEYVLNKSYNTVCKEIWRGKPVLTGIK